MSLGSEVASINTCFNFSWQQNPLKQQAAAAQAKAATLWLTAQDTAARHSPLSCWQQHTVLWLSQSSHPLAESR
jgi:hypothetical protein